MKANEYNISSEKFVLVGKNRQIHDKELSTKPISYFADAFSRFKRNKASIVATVIIGILILFAIIGPILSPYKVSYSDGYYKYTLPKNELFVSLGIDFWDGCSKKETTAQDFLYYYGIGYETGDNVIVNQQYTTEEKLNNKKQKTMYYGYKIDSYKLTGVVFMNLSVEEYKALQEYQNKTGIQVIYPITSTHLRPQSEIDRTNANYWYETSVSGGKTKIPEPKGNKPIESSFKNIYAQKKTVEEIEAYLESIKPAPNEDTKFYDTAVAFLYGMLREGDGNYDSLRIDGDNGQYYYAFKNSSGYEVRLNYYEYYRYYHSEVLKDGIEYPSFIFGTTHSGQDIFTCLSGGARFSFILAIIVASINLFVGAIYGAIEGYYGGKIDIIMERFVDILSAVPFMVVITLLKYHMKDSGQVLILFIAFFLTGWIGMAGRTRMQFYRFKNQEYVLAARTLGATDARIMFKHIFPNALGTLITSCVLVIPSVIFSETSLSYLGIINLNTGDTTSVGTLLANAQPYLVQYPHMIFFPALFICLLMLSFNLFGNGLRDAFNPSLRGTED